MENILGYTTEQIEKMAHNYLILCSEGFLRIEKFIKMFAYKNPMGYDKQSIEVRVKVTNALGKSYTEKVFMHVQSDYPSVVGYDFQHKKVEELLGMELLPNTVFEKSFEEAQKENAESIAKSKRDDFLRKLSLELLYNIKQQRKASAAKRSYKKYTIEELEGAIPDLKTDAEKNYLLLVIDALNDETKPKQTIKEFIASFKGVKREIFEQLEKSFEEREKQFFSKCLEWFSDMKEFNHLTKEELLKEVENYVEMQKWNLFRSANKYLAPLEIKSIFNSYFRSTDNGFEGEWVLTLEDGSVKDFTTKTIIAEGLIQRAHYRYITNLK